MRREISRGVCVYTPNQETPAAAVLSRLEWRRRRVQTTTTQYTHPAPRGPRAYGFVYRPVVVRARGAAWRATAAAAAARRVDHAGGWVGGGADPPPSTHHHLQLKPFSGELYSRAAAACATRIGPARLLLLIFLNRFTTTTTTRPVYTENVVVLARSAGTIV